MNHVTQAIILQEQLNQWDNKTNLDLTSSSAFRIRGSTWNLHFLASWSESSWANEGLESIYLPTVPLPNLGLLSSAENWIYIIRSLNLYHQKFEFISFQVQKTFLTRIRNPEFGYGIRIVVSSRSRSDEFIFDPMRIWKHWSSINQWEKNPS